MTCREVLDRVEEVAAGDEPATPAFREHVEGCLSCAAALATARRIDEALTARPAPPAPARFTAAVIGHIRRERWQSEQYVDRIFNVALALGMVAAIAGVLALTNLGGVLGAIGAGNLLLNQVVGRAVAGAAPAVRTYVLAGAFLLTSLLVWWWAERRLSM